MNLFDYSDKYPLVPGAKREGTSREAAEEMKASAPDLREQCLRVLKASLTPLTADEVASVLDKSPLSIRPRLSELVRLGRIKEGPTRRRNKSGKMAATWEPA
jgi:predicted ArsR family transcriptional regulator